jgi:hypothetical protein
MSSRERVLLMQCVLLSQCVLLIQCCRRECTVHSQCVMCHEEHAAACRMQRGASGLGLGWGAAGGGAPEPHPAPFLLRWVVQKAAKPLARAHVAQTTPTTADLAGQFAFFFVPMPSRAISGLPQCAP